MVTETFPAAFTPFDFLHFKTKGTIGVLHTLSNNQQHLQFEKDSPIQKFLQNTSTLAPSERAKLLEEEETLAVAHKEAANEGQTRPPAPETNVNLHFIAFVHKDGHIFELDGELKDFLLMRLFVE